MPLFDSCFVKLECNSLSAEEGVFGSASYEEKEIELDIQSLANGHQEAIVSLRFDDLAQATTAAYLRRPILDLQTT